jgi:acetyl esterase
MSLKYAHYFDSDPDWLRFASEHGYPIKEPPYAPVTLDIEADREAQKISEGEWETCHPLRDVGYSPRIERVQVRDGEKVEVKICRSTRVDSEQRLPLLFVTHGGGWVQGTHITEEAWLLWPLFQRFEFVTVSVDYRLAPENKFPTYFNDCWDVLINTVARADELNFDKQKVILAGSSAGGGIAASLSQRARVENMPVRGVVLNVPVLCDYRHFPKDDYEYTSYDQCMGTLLESSEMKQMWDVVIPDEHAGKDPKISPFLGDVKGLPPHAVFVAGQDPLRDEAIAYAEKLKSNGVLTTMHIYPGVPHSFAEFWDLKATQKFWGDLRASVRTLLRSP